MAHGKPGWTEGNNGASFEVWDDARQVVDAFQIGVGLSGGVAPASRSDVMLKVGKRRANDRAGEAGGVPGSPGVFL